ncbi:MAG: DUF3604 domain-containing protein [Myxococcota bacterium]|nr:DUF3604 domain-containing protein [Myxococcota bacterium]
MTNSGNRVPPSLQASMCAAGRTLSAIGLVLAIGALASAEPTAHSEAAVAVYSPGEREDFPREPLWGDTHLHSSLSQDAYSFGVTLGSDDAYRFARGETITATHGQKARLDRPLDFLVIADHASGMGSMQELKSGNPKLVSNPRLQEWRALLLEGGTAAGLKISEDGRIRGWPTELNDPEILAPVWQQVVDVAERHNSPGEFTALIGYEWTSWPKGDNLHRVVIFRDGADKVRNIMPFSSFHSDDPEDLWEYLAKYEKDSQGRVLAIPHNGNISNGLMFETRTRAGDAFDADYATRRARWEPITEVTQIKGDGETHPFLSPNDEFADYETWDQGNFVGTPKTDEMLQYEYGRSALKLGIDIYGELGVNPFKFGMIGSTDSHTALSTADEDNFFGKHSAGMEPAPGRERRLVGKAGDILTMGWRQAASGYAAVWARDNTRESIWDAMARKEVYATTGPRITLRFFGGWAFEDADANSSEFVPIGYTKGVPMGGDLASERNRESVPSFLIAAMRDPLGANLDRIQVVKGWRNKNGDTLERVYDVAWSDRSERRINRAGRLTAVGNTVNRDNATYSNKIGAAELRTVWRDPDFSPDEAAFYYVRVLEIPTPRWTDYDAAVFGTSLSDESSRLVNQDRAYSSPIWYAPPPS